MPVHDHCDMRSARFISPNLLERIADPASPFHSDYLTFRRGELTRAELIARLPHVAMLGDSVCLGIYISSPWSTFWRAHTRRGRNWFLDTASLHRGSPRRIRPVADIRSVSRRLEDITPFVAIEYAGIGALVDHEECRLNFFRRVLGTHNFSGQISQVLRSRRFPDLVLISIGHNNVDWAWRCPPDELNAPEWRLKNQSQ